MLATRRMNSSTAVKAAPLARATSTQSATEKRCTRPGAKTAMSSRGASFSASSPIDAMPTAGPAASAPLAETEEASEPRPTLATKDQPSATVKIHQYVDQAMVLVRSSTKPSSASQAPPSHAPSPARRTGETLTVTTSTAKATNKAVRTTPSRVRAVPT
ncbi:hypothetical protein ASF38_07430 [Aeromicrobium sp. Leaf272]|nr:hypothetical protein ASF38_07430 [Aeromicrobium sp. Leaf272]